MIDGVQVIPLRQILDERGKVMHMLRVIHRISAASAKSISRRCIPARSSMAPA